ncbi:MAG: hypothetical protein QOE65_438 [Solirubrobacteraceae bacterium]|nr:hypothetical protein [Solirubrobacteraceae bacterium]
MTLLPGAASLVRDFFLAPAGTVDMDRVAPVPPVFVVLGDRTGAATVGCAAALALARHGDCSHAVAAVWPAAAAHSPQLPATRAARRAAGRLAERGCATDATGRLVRVRLPDGPVEAVAAAQRVVAVADAPVAIALAGARTAELDALLTVGDAALLVRRAGAEPALTRLAEAGLVRLGVPVFICEARPTGVGRLLAVTGIGVASPIRRALAPALAAVA